MPDDMSLFDVPVPESDLRNLAKNVTKTLPNFAELEASSGVKALHDIIDPVLHTADLPDLKSNHLAAASNALCSIIERAHASGVEYVRNAILDDSVWLRLFGIYLKKSSDTKGKSMRQLLIVLTHVTTKNPTSRACEVRTRAAATFMAIICQRQERITVKPALQGLAHFLLKDAISITQLVKLHAELHEKIPCNATELVAVQQVFKSFLAWAVHHDTALSAGHLVKNFLLQARRLPQYGAHANNSIISPLWIEPIIQTIQDWPDRIQELKTHVFPHCFTPEIDEYTRFLSYLHFNIHVRSKDVLPPQLRAFEHLQTGFKKSEEFKILLAAIETGKELTIIRDNSSEEHSATRIENGAIYLPDYVFRVWMSHAEPEVRLAGMFLAIYSTSITKAIPCGVFVSLKRNLVHLHTDTDTDANFRREVYGYLQKLFDRLRASTATLAKGKLKYERSNGSRISIPRECFNFNFERLEYSHKDPLVEALAFVTWYLRFLEWEIRPTASYPRRITTLRSLVIILRSGLDPGVPHAYLSKSAQGQLNWVHGIQIANDRLIRVLLDVVLDPFDDVRNDAISVLQLCLKTLPQAQRDGILATIPRFLSRAEATMLQSGRADQADGVARTYGLIYSLSDAAAEGVNNAQFSSKLGVFEDLIKQLDTTLDVAHNNLSEAVDGRPIHGIYAALRYIIDQDNFYTALSGSPRELLERWKELHANIIKSTEKLWAYVRHILCADAPEGHVPDELEEDVGFDTKEILSYSWRGVKEASTFLRVIITKCPVGDDDSSFLTPQQLGKTGQLCFTQLLELRHRGAFSTVSQTFAAFCRRCVVSNTSLLRALPETLYQETLHSIQDKADAITRRSAGIPALMSGIVAAEPQTDGKLFSRVMQDLITEVSVDAKSANIEESRLPQVHALNCIKEFFTSSKLSVASEPYMGQCLELAAKTLNSKIWPIRNCGLMLFKALIERLLGSDETQDWKEQDRSQTSRFSYDLYPSLVAILSDLLNPDGPLKQSLENAPDSSSPLDLHGAEGVFPALQILRQARPPDTHLEKILRYVEKLLASPHWHLRDMAAQTIVALRSMPELYAAGFSLLRNAPPSTNTQHGTLLAVKYMFRKLFSSPTHLSSIEFGNLIKEMKISTQQWYSSSRCPFIRSTFLDIVSLCGISLLRTQDTSLVPPWTDLADAVSIGPQYSLDIHDDHGSALLMTSLAHVFFIDRIILRDQSEGGEEETFQSIGDALTMLATEDPDTCCAALETIDAILQLEDINSLAVSSSTLSTYVHNIILSATDAEVLSKAQAVLANALTNDNAKADFFTLVIEDEALRTIAKLEAQCLDSPPSNQRSALHLLGFFLNHAYHTFVSHRPSILYATARYIRLLRMALIDTNPFDTRFAAAQSIYALHHLWSLPTTSPPTSALLLGLSLILYDLLADDDDEIRSLAASATAKLLRAQDTKNVDPTVPILTTHRLALFLSTAFATSKHLVPVALRRLTTASLNTLFSTTLARERHIDTALFATEKQNLYKDDALDIVLWARVLSNIPPHTISTELKDSLATWVLDGLSILTVTAEKEVDGALGWTGKAEVFALGLRVAWGAGVVLGWSRGLVGEKDGEVRSKVLTALRRFADVGVEAEIHPLWLETVERVLEKHVLQTLGEVRRGLVLLGEKYAV